MIASIGVRVLRDGWLDLEIAFHDSLIRLFDDLFRSLSDFLELLIALGLREFGTAGDLVIFVYLAAIDDVAVAL